MAAAAKLSMRTSVKLAPRGVSMPMYGFGTYKLKGAKCKKMVTAALKRGVRHIDTASFYDNEKYVGEAIRESGIPREDIFVTTKLWPDDHGFAKATNAFYTSLSKLGFDYIDLYLIHWPGGAPAELRKESWQALEKLLAEGKCKAIGVSNYTIKHLKELLLYCKIPPAVNQVEFHPKLYQKELLHFCNEKGIALGAYSSLAKGALISNKTIVSVATKYSKTPAQILLRWALEHEAIVIPKCSTEERLEENMALFDWEIKSEDMKILDGMHEDWHCTWDPSQIK